MVSHADGAFLIVGAIRIHSGFDPQPSSVCLRQSLGSAGSSCAWPGLAPLLDGCQAVVREIRLIEPGHLKSIARSDTKESVQPPSRDPGLFTAALLLVIGL